MKKITSLLILSTLGLSILVGFNAKAQNEGEQIFNTTCIACHSIGGGKLVGPDLKDVHQKRSEGWLIKFIRSSQTMIAEGDEEAIKVFNENFMIPMPDNALTDEQIKSIIAYMKLKSGGEETASTEEIAQQPPSDSPKKGEDAIAQEIPPVSTDETQTTEDVKQSELIDPATPSVSPDEVLEKSDKKETPSINKVEKNSSFRKEEGNNSTHNSFLIWLLISANVILLIVILVLSQSIRTLTKSSLENR